MNIQSYPDGPRGANLNVEIFYWRKLDMTEDQEDHDHDGTKKKSDAVKNNANSPAENPRKEEYDSVDTSED
jgi:hypothetical protein